MVGRSECLWSGPRLRVCLRPRTTPGGSGGGGLLVVGLLVERRGVGLERLDDALQRRDVLAAPVGVEPLRVRAVPRTIRLSHPHHPIAGRYRSEIRR